MRRIDLIQHQPHLAVTVHLAHAEHLLKILPLHGGLRVELQQKGVL